MLCIKKSKCILDISLNKHIFLLKNAVVNHLQRIHDVHCLLTLMCFVLTLLSVSGVHIHVYNVGTRLAYNHAIKLVNTGTGTCLSTLDR